MVQDVGIVSYSLGAEEGGFDKRPTPSMDTICLTFSGMVPAIIMPTPPAEKTTSSDFAGMSLNKLLASH